jgi:hypothetical protein
MRARRRPFACTELSIAVNAAQARCVIEASIYAAGARPYLSQSVARARAAGCVKLEHRRSSSERLLYSVDQLLERKGFCQKRELLAVSR